MKSENSDLRTIDEALTLKKKTISNIIKIMQRKVGVKKRIIFNSIAEYVIGFFIILQGIGWIGVVMAIFIMYGDVVDFFEIEHEHFFSIKGIFNIILIFFSIYRIVL